MPQEQITIKFLPDGDEKLIAAINKLSVSTKKLTGATNETAVATKRAARATDEYRIRGNQLAKGNDAIAKSFATIRSQMLLFTFAMSLGVRQVIGFIKEAAKVDSMSRAFDSLSGGAGNAKIALTQLSDAAGGTMSQFDLLQQANNALILGVVKNSDEMNEMFKVAIKLGRAVGRTAKESVESLVTGIGRQSRLMLDNIGIIMNAEKAYAAYAAELGVTVESLDDAERRQAFLSATMESAREKARLLGDDIETMQSRIEKATAAMSDAKVELGKASVSVFNLDENIGIFTKTLRMLLKPMEDVTNTDLNLILQTTARALMLANPRLMGFAKLLGISVSELKPFSEATDDANNKQIEFNRNLKENNEKIQKKANELIAETVAGKMRAISVTIDFVKANKDLFKSEQNVVDVIAMLEKQYKDLDPKEKERIENLKALTKQQKELERWQKEQSKGFRQAEEDIERMFPSYIEYRNQITLQLEADEKLQKNMAKTIAWLDKMGIAHNLETDAMRKSREEGEEYNDALEAALATWEKRVAEAKAYKIALEDLKIVEMEHTALLDGQVDTSEKLAINNAKMVQAAKELADARAGGDVGGEAQALSKINSLIREKSKIVKDAEDAVKDAADKEQAAIDATTKAQQKAIVERQRAIQGIVAQYDAEAALALALKEKELLLDGEIDRADQLVLVNMQLAEAEMKLAQAINLGDIDAQVAAQATLNQLKQEGIDLADKEIEQLATIQDVYAEAYSAISDIVVASQNSIMDGIREQNQVEINELKKTNKYKMASEAQQAKMEDAIKKRREKEWIKAFRIQQMAQVGQVWMNIALAITKEYTGGLIKGMMSQPLLMAIGGIQSAAIMAQKPPKMARGGIIGGRRHSQGGTMIEAEQGEFIMSRSAVDSVGIENLNRMNEGGGGGSVTVNVSGNVMTEEFTEEQVLPAIRQALRRGDNLDHVHPSNGLPHWATD